MAATTQQQGTNVFDRPPYEADWQVDQSQSSKELLDRHRRNAANPAAHEVYRKQLEDKEREFGVIHVDPKTGYRARFKPQGAGAGAGSTGDRSASGSSARADAGQGGTSDRASGQRADAGAGTGDQGARIADLERQLAEARGQGGGQA